MSFALQTSQLPPDDSVWTVPQSPGVLPLPAPGPPAPVQAGTPAEPSPAALEERALLGAPFVGDPQPEPAIPELGPELVAAPVDPHRFRPPPSEVNPFQAEEAEAASYAWKQSGVLQAPAGGASMRVVDGDIVPSSGRKPSPPVSATDRAGAFQELQEGDPQNTFQRWVDTVVENQINPSYSPGTDGEQVPMCDEDFDMVAGIPPGASSEERDAARRAYMQGLLPKDPSGLTRTTVRDTIKSEYDVVGATQDPERLDALYPGVPDDEASHRELQRMVLGNGVTDGLASSDEGALGERWYGETYAPDAVTQAPMPNAPSGQDRRADFVVPVGPSIAPFAQASETIELKSGAEGLSGHPAGATGPATDEHLQLDDYAQAVESNAVINAGGSPAQVVEHKYVNLDPRAAFQNADTMAEQVVAGALEYEAFNPAGQRQTWSEADTWKLNLVPDGANGAVRLDPNQQMVQRAPAELAEEIRMFSQQPIPSTGDEPGAP